MPNRAKNPDLAKPKIQIPCITNEDIPSTFVKGFKNIGAKHKTKTNIVIKNS